ncbi:acyl carrier protein [Kitasatospora sp. NPDC056651]|uniref:acyl carrier protein n=1 Tax=Kitasatospora sp. NPDC056651 TaxID=3345892 RepID=UPI0036CD6E3D
MSIARALVGAALDHPGLIDRLADDTDFTSAGVNSGELIKIALACEEALGRALDDLELAELTTVSAVAALFTADLADAADRQPVGAIGGR